MGDTSRDLEQREEALKAAAEAVERHRSLARDNPDALPGLASSLNDLGYTLSRLGRHEEALKAAAEAVEVCWARAQHIHHDHTNSVVMERVDECIHLVGMSLDLLEALLAVLVRLDEALTAAPDSDAFLPGLAGNLHHLADWLAKAPTLGMAESAAWKAVLFFLAAFEPGPAGRLGDLGSIANTLGRRPEGLTVPRAVELWRSLAQRNPEAFHPGLADSFTLLSRILSELGEHEEALTVMQGAVELRRVLTQRDPEAFLPHLASSLETLGDRLNTRKRHEEALRAMAEAVELHRALARRAPEAFPSHLTWSLSELSARLGQLGRYEEALASVREANDHLWPQLEHHPERWELVDITFSLLQEIHSCLERPLPVALQERRAAFERLKKPKRVLLS